MDILDFDELVCLANIDLENDRVAEALVKLKYALRKEDNTAVHPMIARVYARLGLFERSKHYFERYLAENPSSLVELFQYGMTHFDSNDHKSAFAVFNTILEQSPDHPPALYYSSVILAKEGRLQESKGQLESLIKNTSKANLFCKKAKILLSEIDPEVVTTESTESTDEAEHSATNSSSNILLN